MKRFFTPLVFFFIALTGQAQDGNLDNLDFARGSIILSNGKILAGFINYNTRDGILFYKNDGETGVFNPRNVRSFSFFDAKQSAVRRFYSLEYEDQEQGTRRFYFFELLEEFTNFAILAKVDQMEIKSSTYYTTLASTIGFPTTTFNSPYKPIQYKKQDETIYLIDSQGLIQPYLETRYIYKGYGTYVRTRVFEKNLLPRFFGKMFHSIEEFSKKNNLAFDNRNDFLKMVAYYRHISE